MTSHVNKHPYPPSTEWAEIHQHAFSEFGFLPRTQAIAPLGLGYDFGNQLHIFYSEYSLP